MKRLGALLTVALAAVAGFSYTSETLPNGDTLLKFTAVGDEVYASWRDYERVTVLIVGGGGGGGYGCAAGGGGGGEVVVLSNQTILAGAKYAVRVGAGGTVDSNIRTGGNGGDSSFGDVVALGGGGGGGDASSSTEMQRGLAGGNGGGSGARGSHDGGAGTGRTAVEGDAHYFGGFAGGKGNQGSWNSAGGGGATGCGATGSGLKGNGGAGGDGIALDITGETVYYGCGGGGGANGNASGGVTGGTGGSGGVSGGNAADGSRRAVAGRANTGTGGGAGAYSAERQTDGGAAGGSGAVYIRIPGDQPAWKAKGYAHSTEFSVVGYRGAAPLADMPLLVRIKEGTGGFSYGDLQSDDGRDIRFTLADDTILVHEIDTFDPGGTSYFWVKVPELANGLRLKLHWGKADDHIPDAKTVFAGAVGVYHLGEAEGPFADASPCKVAASRMANGGNTPFQTPGRIGRATCVTDSRVDGNASEGGIYVPAAGGIATLSASNVFTVTGWFKQSGAVSGKDEGLFMSDGQALTVRRFWDGGDSVYCGTSGMKAKSVFNGRKSEWTFLAFVYDGTNCRVYKNGGLLATVAGAPALYKALAVGCRYNGNGDMSFHGVVDEVRIFDGQLSPDRIQAEYDMAVTSRKFLSCDDTGSIYVVPPGAAGAMLGTPPYDSWETAATNLADAVAGNVELVDVKVAPGRYPLAGQLSLDNAGVVYSCVDPASGEPVPAGAVIDAGGVTWTASAVVLSGASMRGFAIVNATNTTAGALGGGLYVRADGDPAHFIADTVVSNCCLSGGGKAMGGGIYLEGGFRGIVSNCLIVANSGPIGGGLYCKNTDAASIESHPTVVDSTFDANVMNGNWGMGGAAYAVGIAFRNCTFTRNALGPGLSSYSPCVHSEGCAQFSGCRFVGNLASCPDAVGASAIYAASSDVIRNCVFTRNADVTFRGNGLLENCVLTNNAWNAVRGGASLRNCLIANNVVGVCVTVRGTNRIENCTITGNTSNGIQGNTDDSGAFLRTVIVNSIVVGNATSGDAYVYDYATWRSANDCIVSNSVVGTLFSNVGHDSAEDSNRWVFSAAAVRFANAADGDYTLKRRSPCRDRGVRLGWMTETAVDLAGNPRVLQDGRPAAGALPDLGCYENRQAAPGVLISVR